MVDGGILELAKKWWQNLERTKKTSDVFMSVKDESSSSRVLRLYHIVLDFCRRILRVSFILAITADMIAL